MPVIRVMNWNIEQLSWNKVNKPGMLNAIARTVNAENIDVLVLLEVRITKVMNAMTALSAALGSAAGGGTGGAAHNWQCFFLSFQTGKERYCVFIRDLDVVRPVHPVAGIGPTGTENDRLTNLQLNIFQLWPHADWNTSAYLVPMPGVGFRLPLLDLYASQRAPRAAKARRSGFAGQPIANGGYSLGRGYRTPALALLMVHGAGGDYLVPIIMCHYASGSANPLARSQVGQLKYLHLAQLFDNNPSGGPIAPGGPLVPGQSGYIDVLNAAGAHTAVRIQELAFTGDFNIDFLQNIPGPGNTPTEGQINMAYSALTPAVAAGGSGAPAALPGAALPAPGVPFVIAVPPPAGPVDSTIGAQRLRTAVTSQGTIMGQLMMPPAPPAGVIPPAPYVTAALDNFLYGGTNLAGAFVNFGLANNDSGQVVNVPANIVNAAAANPPDIDLRGTAVSYAATNTKKAQYAMNLQGGGAPPPALTALDRLIGARLVSDHLPVVLQFTCP
jgi:hypothetical protein